MIHSSAQIWSIPVNYAVSCSRSCRLNQFKHSERPSVSSVSLYRRETRGKKHKTHWCGNKRERGVAPGEETRWRLTTSALCAGCIRLEHIWRLRNMSTLHVNPQDLCTIGTTYPRLKMNAMASILWSQPRCTPSPQVRGTTGRWINSSSRSHWEPTTCTRRWRRVCRRCTPSLCACGSSPTRPREWARLSPTRSRVKPTSWCSSSGATTRWRSWSTTRHVSPSEGMFPRVDLKHAEGIFGDASRPCPSFL